MLIMWRILSNICQWPSWNEKPPCHERIIQGHPLPKGFHFIKAKKTDMVKINPKNYRGLSQEMQHRVIYVEYQRVAA
jgi:hypothetical protein